MILAGAASTILTLERASRPTIAGHEFPVAPPNAANSTARLSRATKNLCLQFMPALKFALGSLMRRSINKLV